MLLEFCHVSSVWLRTAKHLQRKEESMLGGVLTGASAPRSLHVQRMRCRVYAELRSALQLCMSRHAHNHMPMNSMLQWKA